MTRREALQLAAAALAAPSFAAQKAPWSGYVTSAFAVDDVRRLIVLDPKADAAVRTALTTHPAAAKLGCALTTTASNWRPKPEADAALTDPVEQLAVAAGAMVNSAALEILGKQSYDALALDAALLSARHPSPAKLTRTEYLEFLKAVDIRCQIELHTLDPEESDIHAWLAGTARWYRDGQNYLGELAAALAAGAGSPLFDASDPLFRLSERVRRAEPVTKADLQAAKPSSAYGRALRHALDQVSTG